MLQCRRFKPITPCKATVGMIMVYELPVADEMHDLVYQ
jgi:hypothetical protein